MNKQFAMCIKQHLLKHVNGTVKFWLIDDDLEITIYGTNDTVFKYILANLSSTIWQGYTSETCSQIILKRYKQYIINLYFK